MSGKSGYKIFIDSSKRYEKSVKLFDGEILLDEVYGDIDMVSEIQRLCDLHNVNIPDVTCDFFRGPGESMTGLKLSSVISNIINWANGADVKEIKLPDYGREPNITLKKF